MRLASIGSGSSGNCIYAGNDKTHIIIDDGFSLKKTIAGLSAMDISYNDIQALLITHEHMDHIAGLGVFLRKHPVPVFATSKTIDKILSVRTLGKMDRSLFQPIRPDESFSFHDVAVEASEIYHDAADPVCYTLKDERSKVAVATDLGTFDDYLVEKLSGCETLLIESNHDLSMLMAGPYPYPLKRRIMSNTGHMSNERAGQLLSKIIGDTCRHIYLGHLSKENNYSPLAYEAVKVELLLHNIDLEKKNITMQVASRTDPTIAWKPDGADKKELQEV